MPSRLCNKDPINRSLVNIPNESVRHRNSVRKWFSFSCFPPPKKTLEDSRAWSLRIAVSQCADSVHTYACDLLHQDSAREGSFARSYPLSHRPVDGIRDRMI